MWQQGVEPLDCFWNGMSDSASVEILDAICVWKVVKIYVKGKKYIDGLVQDWSISIC